MSDDDPVKILGNPTALSLCEKFKDIANMSKMITYLKTKICKLSMKQAYLQRPTPTGFQTEILIVKSKERKIQAKPLQNLTNAIQLTFTAGVTKW
jgi:hypothetical protein